MNPWSSIALFSLAFASSSCARQNAEPQAMLLGQRIVSRPSSIAFVSSDRVAAGLAGEIRFGGPLGRSALYLKFQSEPRTGRLPQKAFLTLAAREGGASSDGPLTLEAWRISADWQPHALEHWCQKPSLAPPYSRLRVTPSPTREARIDVTELVRYAARHPERDFGIAVIASGSEGPSATFSSGFAGGQAPLLELYLP